MKNIAPLPSVAARNWVQQPSLELCAGECGARCCRFGFFPVNTKQMRALKALKPELKVLNHKRDMWVVDFDLNGGQCPFLGDDNACTIYEQRPNACRNFPVKPYEDCLVWPAT